MSLIWSRSLNERVNECMNDCDGWTNEAEGGGEKTLITKRSDGSCYHSRISKSVSGYAPSFSSVAVKGVPQKEEEKKKRKKEKDELVV